MVGESKEMEGKNGDSKKSTPIISLSSQPRALLMHASHHDHMAFPQSDLFKISFRRERKGFQVTSNS